MFFSLESPNRFRDGRINYECEESKIEKLMNRLMLMKFFMWNTIFSIGLLLLWTIVFATSADFIYEIHNRIFAISRDNFNAIIYGLIGLFKMLALTFFIFPLLSMLMLSRNSYPSKS